MLAMQVLQSNVFIGRTEVLAKRGRFSDESADFADSSFAFVNYISVLYIGVSRELGAAAVEKGPIASQADEDVSHRGTLVNTGLANVLDVTSAALIRSIPDRHGYEAWQTLSQHCRPTSVLTSRAVELFL